MQVPPPFFNNFASNFVFDITAVPNVHFFPFKILPYFAQLPCFAPKSPIKKSSFLKSRTCQRNTREGTNKNWKKKSDQNIELQS